jgi:ATP-binding cassette subfamily C (CFTR/MRP) protein 8/ATP-binding cassette subfamily C (CFTR/MRP) protein 9
LAPRSHGDGGAAILAVVTAALPYILLPYLPVFAYYLHCSKIYRATAREVKRLNSNTKSPIFQSFSETLDGLTTIRAFGLERRFECAAFARVDANLQTLKLQEACRRWFAIRLQACSAALVLAAAVLIAANNAGALGRPMEAANAGLALTYALNSVLALQMAIIQLTELELAMNSLERLKAYSELPQACT